MPPDDIRAIKTLAEQYRRAEERVDEARSRLYEAIRRARPSIDGGPSLRELAAITGLSFARIHQIVRGE